MSSEMEAMLSEQSRLLQELSQREPDLAAALRENARRLQDLRDFAEEQRQRFLSRMLLSITERKLILCSDRRDLPKPLEAILGVSDEEPDPASLVSIPLSRATLQTVRQQAEKVAVACGLSQERQHDLLTAVGEATMNAVRHSTASGNATARVLGDVQERTVQVWIEDKGLRVESPMRGSRMMEDDFTSGHIGFWTMLQTCDKLYLLTGSDGTTVVLEVKGPPGQTATEAS
jgi:anti-sigma regulatory factor (Ser/Thr protein kinase)